MTRYIVDTHALLWYLSNDARLGANAKTILHDSDTRLIVPALVLAEAKHAADRQRVSIPFEQVLQAIVNSERITVYPLALSVVNHLSSALDIHDSIIVATALQCKEFFDEDIAVLTTDRAITASGLITVVW